MVPEVTKQPGHHWDFVDEDGCLHCNCGIGVIAPTPGSRWIDKPSEVEQAQGAWKAAHDDLYNRLTHMQAERDAMQAERDDLAEQFKQYREYHEWCGECGEARADIPRCTVCVVEYVPRQAAMLDRDKDG